MAPLYQQPNQPRAIRIPSIIQAFVKVQPCSQPFPTKDCLAVGPGHFLNAVSLAEINASLKIVSVAGHWGIMYSIPGQALLFHFMFYPEKFPMASVEN